jgi:hypothetical protein
MNYILIAALGASALISLVVLYTYSGSIYNKLKLSWRKKRTRHHVTPDLTAGRILVSMPVQAVKP